MTKDLIMMKDLIMTLIKMSPLFLQVVMKDLNMTKDLIMMMKDLIMIMKKFVVLKQ